MRLLAGRVGNMVDEPACDAVAERRIGRSVQDERVPADIDLPRRRQVRVGPVRARIQERELLLGDVLGVGGGFADLFGDSRSELIEQSSVDQVTWDGGG